MLIPLVLCQSALAGDLSAPGALPAVDGEVASRFGDELLREGDADGAALWYRLALHLGPDADTLDPLIYRLGLSLEARGRFMQAAQTYARVQGPLDPQATYREAIARFRGGARNTAEELLLGLDGTELDATAAYSLGVLWLEAGEPKAAAQAFSQVPEGPLHEAATRFGDRAERPLRLKAPAATMALSAIPGVGQIYAGKRLGGILTLVGVGGLGMGSWMMTSWGMEEKEPMGMMMGGALGTGMVVAWGTGFWSAWKAAKETNARITWEATAGLAEQARAAAPDLPLEPSAHVIPSH